MIIVQTLYTQNVKWHPEDKLMSNTIYYFKRLNIIMSNDKIDAITTTARISVVHCIRTTQRGNLELHKT